MDYYKNLQQLRAAMLEKTTKKPQEQSLESFIPARQQEPQQEDTQSLLQRSAEWLSSIKQGTQKIKEQAPEPQENGMSTFMSALGEALFSDKEEAPSEKKESFIKRRSEDSPSTYAPERPKEKSYRLSGKPIPIDAEVSNVLNALAAVESRGSGDYKAVGPVVKKGMYKGQRAYGRYQVMEGNIGPWTKDALGKAMTKEEFVASPEAQDAVAARQLQKAKDKYGTWEDAASVWFSGRPLSKAGNASDDNITVPEYISKFRRFYEG